MRKSLSILLALLMILSSLPVMAFTASAEEAAQAETTDPNVMANYTYSNWQTRRWGSSNQGTESLNGGTSIYIKSVNYQKAFTTVVLKPNTTYLLDFNWKADTNESGNGVYPQNVWVFPESAYGSNAAFLAPAPGSDLGNYSGSGSWHHDNGDFYPAGKTGTITSLGADLESATNDTTSRKNATAGTWQHFSTKFTTNSSETNYAIMMDFVANSTGNAGPNAVTFSDFRLISTEDSALVPIEDKMASDWHTPDGWGTVITDDTSFTKDGITSKYKVSCITYQTSGVELVLEPNTTYIFSSDHYNQSIDGSPYIQRILVVPSSKSSSFDDQGSSADWSGYADPTKAYDTWVHTEFAFTTTNETKYVLKIHGEGAIVNGNHRAQTTYFANLKITKPEKEGNLLNNATYGKGDVSWSTEIGHRLDPRTSFKDGLDNPKFSINGGFAWGFGFGYAELTGENFGYVYIKANGLKAGKTYDFSYICRNDFRFAIDTIKSGDNLVTNFIEAPAYSNVVSPDSKPAQKTATLFTVPVDGDYVITLKANRDAAYRMPGITWTTTYLCDLELYERGALYNVAVAKDGYGVVNASKTGLVEEGTVVTFTAHADLYEKFEGWYVGDTLVSKEETYAHTVSADVTAVAKFTTRSINLMADYTTSNFVTRDWGYIQNGESHYGGNAVRGYNIPHQSVITKVTLEANKEYVFSFDCRSIENISNKGYVNTIKVRKILTPENDILYKPTNGVSYSGSLGDDIELGTNGSYISQEQANKCEWQTITTKFTTTEAGEYAIIMDVRHDDISRAEAEAIRANHSDVLVDPSSWDRGYKAGDVHNANNNQSIDFSDFILKTKPEITYTGTKYEWLGAEHAVVSESTDTKDGGYAYRIDKAMMQNISTELTLKPGTTYKYSFNWKALSNEKGLAFVSNSSIYSANSGDRSKGNKTNYEWTADGSDYIPTYIPNDGYVNLMTNVSNPNGSKTAEDSALTSWNTYSATFTTIEDSQYYLFIKFDLKGAVKDQTVIISDVIIEEVVEGVAPAGDDMIAHPGVSIRKNTESVYGQALRYKFTVDGEVIANAQADGYELVEYGTVVALASELNGHAADPILNATAYTVRIGVAYNKDDGTNIQFAVAANGDVTYTAALYNIPTTNYDSDIAVRPYAVFRNADGNTYVRYGTTRTASVFDVAKAVLDGNNTDDQAYVNNTLLAGSIKDAYNEWLAK